MKLGFATLKLKGEVEVDEAYVPVGCKGKRCTRPRRRGSGRRRGRNTVQKKPFFTLFERGSRKALFLAEDDAFKKTVTEILLRYVEHGSIIYTDEFRSYKHVSKLGYDHFLSQALG